MPALSPPAIEAMVADGFAPLLGTPYRYRIEQARDDAGTARRYATDRTIVFRRQDGGLVADLTITAVDGGLATGPGALLERAFAGLRGRVIRYRLSPTGRVTAIDDRQALWQALTDAVVAQAGDDPARVAIAQRLAAPLRTMPDAAQIAMLGSMLTTVMAPDTIRRGVVPERAVRQDGTPPFGTGSVVIGTERVHAQGRLLVEERRLSGTVAAPGGVQGQRTTTLTRRIDRATGMIVDQRETVRIETGGTVSLATTRSLRTDP